MFTRTKKRAFSLQNPLVRHLWPKTRIKQSRKETLLEEKHQNSSFFTFDNASILDNNDNQDHLPHIPQKADSDNNIALPYLEHNEDSASKTDNDSNNDDDSLSQTENRDFSDNDDDNLSGTEPRTEDGDFSDNDDNS